LYQAPDKGYGKNNCVDHQRESDEVKNKWHRKPDNGFERQAIGHRLTIYVVTPVVHVKDYYAKAN
jgi:hypothetical protein